MQKEKIHNIKQFLRAKIYIHELKYTIGDANKFN